MNRQQKLLERTLVFLVAIAFSATLALAQNAASPAPEEKFQRTFALNPGGTLVVDNYKGTIHVTGSDSNQVVVNVVKRFDGSDSDRKWWMENTSVEFSNDRGRVEVRVRYPTQSWSCWLCGLGHADYTSQVELEIQTPRQTSVEVESYKPDIRISKLNGDIRIKSYKSPMIIDSTTGAIRIDTYKDSIRLKNVTVRGTLEVKSYKAEAEIDAVSLGERAYLENSKGTIILRVPQDTGMAVDFQGGRRSSFRSDFPLNAEAGSRYGHDVRGTINHGGSDLRLRTEKGSVELLKLSAAL
jgi:hypothetical protein